MATQTKKGAGSRVAEALLEKKLITQKQLDRLQAQQEDGADDLVRILLGSGLVTEGAVEVLGEVMGWGTFDLESSDPDRSAATLIDGALARQYTAIPVGFAGDRLLVAMADPTDGRGLDEIAAATGLVIEPALATRAAILRSIDAVYGDASPAVGAPVEEPEDFASAGDSERVGKRLGVGEDVTSVDVHELLEEVLVRGASDLHLTAGVPPVIRLNGDLVHLDQHPVMTAEDLQQVIYGILTQKQREKLENELELDFSYSLPGKARFRVNVYLQRSATGAAFRLIPFEIKSIEDLGLPPRVGEFAKLPRGLVVVTGPTGSGKSTTLASIVDIVNRERPVHIMTIEDPIEFLHHHKQAIVNQREVGTDTHSFAKALKHVLRQDPDVILVGEMRDLETIQMAITAAETGHLVFGTLHTQDAPQTIDRIIDVFPPHQQQQVRVQLAGSLQGVVAQQLLQTVDGKGRAAAIELLVATPAIRNLIREAKTHQIYSSIQSGGQYGMIAMDSSLAELVRRGKISLEAGRERCHSVEEFTRLATTGAGASGGTARARVVG